MALMPQSGSSNPSLASSIERDALGSVTPIPSDSAKNSPLYEDTLRPIDKLDNASYVADPAFEQVAFDRDAYPQSYGQLQGFVKGHRVSVIYYNNLNVGQTVRTNVSDLPTERSTLNSSFRRVMNMEITLQDKFTFEPDTDKGQVNISGVAYIYPYFQPIVGDIFCYAMGDGRWGEFIVGKVTPLTGRNATGWIIDFFLQNWMDAQEWGTLKGMTTETFFFDKINFLGGTASLLTQDQFASLEVMRKARAALSQHYIDTFYNRSMGTVVGPDGLYDPYLTKFVISKLEFDVVGVRPKQLFPTVDQTYNYSIWSRMDADNNVYLGGINSMCIQGISNAFGFDVGVTTLVGRPFVYIYPPDGFIEVDMGYNRVITQGTCTTPPSIEQSYYLFSENFYDGTVGLMTPWESLVYTAITQKKIVDVGGFISTYILPFYALPKDEAYWKIPIYLRLIDLACATITHYTRPWTER